MSEASKPHISSLACQHVFRRMGPGCGCRKCQRCGKIISRPPWVTYGR